MNTTHDYRARRYEKELQALHEDVKEIKQALLGDGYRKEGFVHRLDSYEERIGMLEQLRVQMKWLLVGWGIGGAGLGLGLRELLVRLLGG